MLIHQLSSGMWGKYEEMKDAMENNGENLNKFLNENQKDMQQAIKIDTSK